MKTSSQARLSDQLLRLQAISRHFIGNESRGSGDNARHLSRAKNDTCPGQTPTEGWSRLPLSLHRVKDTMHGSVPRSIRLWSIASRTVSWWDGASHVELSPASGIAILSLGIVECLYEKLTGFTQIKRNVKRGRCLEGCQQNGNGFQFFHLASFSAIWTYVTRMEVSSFTHAKEAIFYLTLWTW